MGAKTALLVYTDGNPAELLRTAREPDLEATKALIAATNPGWDGATTDEGNLWDDLHPDEGIAFAGAFPGIDVLCDRQVMVERPEDQKATGTASAGTPPRWSLRVPCSMLSLPAQAT